MIKKLSPLDKRNITLQILDPGFFMTGLVFFHQMTIMVALIKKLHDSPLLIGMIPGLLLVGYNLPGIFFSRIAERFPIRKKFIGFIGFFQRLFILGMGLSLSLLPKIGSYPTAILVLSLYLGFSFMGGMYSPAWLDFCAKTIPLNYRARTNAFRSILAGIGGILAPLLITGYFTNNPFPMDYQKSIVTGFVFLLISFSAFISIKEVNPSPAVRKKNTRDYFRSLGKVLKEDRNFTRYLVSAGVLSLSECGAGFFVYFGLDRFALQDSDIVTLTLLFNISILGSGFLLGYLGDKWGNLRVIQIGALGYIVTLAGILFFPTPLTLKIVFLFMGMINNARLNCFQVLITEFGNDKNRIRYTTLGNAIAVVSFGVSPFIGGVLLDKFHISFTALFGFSLLASIAGFLLLWRWVKDPRFTQAPQPS